MRIADVMSTHVFRITPDRSTEEAYAEMSARGVHHLVVVDGRDVVGVLSLRDLADRGAQAVRDAMAPRVVTAAPDTTIRDAANLLRGHAIGCLPVVADGELVGIVTTADLLELIGRGVTKPVAESRKWTLRRRSPKQRHEPAPR